MTYDFTQGPYSPACTAGRPRGVRGIVIHWWGYPDQSGSHAGTVAYLTRPTASTSAHYVVSPGLVTEIVAPDNIAWHAGNWDVNEEAVGIECNPHDVQGTLSTVIELVADMMRRYGRDLYVIGHRDATQTTCPGDYYPLVERIHAGALTLLDGGTAMTAASTPATTTPEPQEDDMPLNDADLDRIATRLMTTRLTTMWGEHTLPELVMEAAERASVGTLTRHMMTNVGEVSLADIVVGTQMMVRQTAPAPSEPVDVRITVNGREV